MDKKDDPACSTVLALAALGFVIYVLYQVVQFFQRPDALKTIIEFVAGLGICAGLIVLALIVLVLTANDQSRPKLHWLSREYPVRCYSTNLKKTSPGPIPADLPEESEQAAVYPVYFHLSTTNYGLSVSALSAQDTWSFIPADNASRFSHLNDDHSDPIIIPMGYFYLYYILFHQEGNQLFELAPPHEAGYTGPISASSDKYQVEIVIVYPTFKEARNLDVNVIREQPVKLKLVVLDKNGHDDPDATRNLYDKIFQLMHSSDSDDDDSWMYRSRPMIWPYY